MPKIGIAMQIVPADARLLAAGERYPKTRSDLLELANSYDKLVAEVDHIAALRRRVAG